MMGDETFPSMNPEGYLFGEMSELYFLAQIPGKVSTFHPTLLALTLWLGS